MASSKKARDTPGDKITDPEGDSQSITLSLGAFEGVFGQFTKPLLLAALLALTLACIKPMTSGFFYDGGPLMLIVLGILSAYAVFSQQALRSDQWSWGIPILILISGVFSYYSNAYGYPQNVDYPYFSIMAAIFALFYALSYHKVVNVEFSMVLALFLAALLLHLVPANANLLANLDSYWHYKWMQVIYNTGYPPEYDPLVYPMYGGLSHSSDLAYTSQRPTTFGLVQSDSPMMMQISYTGLALALDPLGVSMFQVAMLFPGILAALTVVVMYLLVKEMFSDMRPYNKLAALLAAFMLMLSPALAANATATNPEDDSFGMFLMVATLFLFFASYQRKSFRYALLTGIAALMLRMSWAGSAYAMMTIGTFGTLYAFVRLAHNKNAIEHLPYILIPVIVYNLMGTMVHARGGAWIFPSMSPNELYPIAATLCLSLILEMIRVKSRGMQLTGGASIEDRTVDAIEKNVIALGIVALILAGIILAFYKTPTDLVDFAAQVILSAKDKSVVHQTVAEQNPLASSFNEFLTQGYNRYGIALLYSIITIPLMAYIVYSTGSIGALFILTWSIPMMWGAYNKSAWIFASSASITALGATIGLFSTIKKSDLESLRIIGTILVICIPIAYVPMFGPALYSKAVGYVVLHMGPTEDIFYWYPMLEWHANNTGPGDAILTWWDYGHWITAVSHRPVLIDNLQADYYEIQDVATFFENKTSEEEAFEMVKAYDKAYRDYNQSWGLRYAAIDWTMIGKGSALHFIATGNIEDVTPGSWKNYAECQFLPAQSQLEERISVSQNGSFSKVRQVVFGCQGYVSGVIFELEGSGIRGITAVDPYGNHIPWDKWSKANDASLLGVQPLLRVNEEEEIPSILYCALNWNSLPRGSICNLPQFKTLVYVPQEFNDFMTTRLYLGKYLDEYRRYGLYTREVKPLLHFRQIPDYDGDGTPDGEFSYGFVRSYEISYEGFDRQPANATSTG
ncbi:MAG: STT3 domain-containing protein [Candidatus Altiarchaeota archaeon]